MSSIEEEVPQNIRLLKTIVIVLGILLVVGFVLVISTIIIRLGNLGDEESAEAQKMLAISTPSAFDVPLTAGESIQNFTLDGNRMALHVEGPQGGRMLIVDLDSGAVRQTIAITAAPE